ncbi:MAG: hypothetical protein JNN07_24435 [Verrucomicrobiales bacterium]|nr:hypothetical protein [Verrucomicrobiales bacterium]
MSRGVPAPVIEARVRMYANNNRLHWKTVKGNDDANIPVETELWPVPTAARALTTASVTTSP